MIAAECRICRVRVEVGYRALGIDCRVGEMGMGKFDVASSRKVNERNSHKV